MKPVDIETGAQFLVSNIDAGEYSKFYMGGEYAPGGYLWLFPKGEHTANVGLGILGSKSEKGMALSLLQKFMKNHMPDARILEMVVGGVPVSGPIKQTATNGLLLVGDAARQSDPVTGGGIINAMDAGKIAGEVCIKACKAGDYSMNTLQEYEDRWRDTFGKSLSKSLKVKNMLLKFSDEQLNQLAHSLVGEDVSKMTLPAVLKILATKNPKMLWEMRSLF
jgi:digeranylgeranylglycerophospholipid reductase